MSDDRISRRQLLAVAMVALFSPVIRRQPGAMVRQAGSAAWLAVVPAFVALLLLCLFLRALLRSRGDGRGMGEIALDALGPVAGRVALLVYAAWFVFYAGFLLRSGADRFISTIYPNSRPWVFACVTLLLCLPACLGQLKSIARASAIFRPVLLIVIALAIISVLPGSDLTGATTISRQDLVPVLAATPPLVNTISLAALLTFLEGRVTEPFKVGGCMRMSTVMLAIVALLCLETCATLGPVLTGSADYPFFLMIRDLSIGAALERVEALVIAVWVFPDFVLISVLLWMARDLLCLCFGLKQSQDRLPPLSMKCGRWLGWLCAAAALICALLMAPRAFDLFWFSDKLIPRLNFLLVFGLLPVIFCIGRLRKRI